MQWDAPTVCQNERMICGARKCAPVGERRLVGLLADPRASCRQNAPPALPGQSPVLGRDLFYRHVPTPGSDKGSGRQTHMVVFLVLDLVRGLAVGVALSLIPANLV